MHCVTLGLGHTWSIELRATMYEKQLQCPTDNTGTSTRRIPVLPNFNVHMITVHLAWSVEKPLNQAGL